MMNTTRQTYEMPLIAADLRRAEFAKQMADAFDHIENISQNVFNRIAIRLNLYRAQLNKFDERIQHASSHIERIRGSNRAIQVHSSARYPVEHNRSTYKSIFEVDPDNDDLKPPILTHNPFRLNETIDKFNDPNDKESKSINTSLIVFNQHDENFLQKKQKGNLQGLDRPPSNIKSVVSLLTYNTKENPYTKPTKIDPLSYGPRKRQENQEPTTRKISEAPVPNFYTQKLQRPTDNGIAYNPTLGQVPQFSLPDNLTELGSFATFENESSIEWTQEKMASIAPSLIMSMLPDIGDSSTGNSNEPTPTPVEPVKTNVPPPPDLPTIIPLNSTVHNPQPVSSTVPVAPLPPPPPPAPAPPLTSMNDGTTSDLPATLLLDNDNDVSSSGGEGGSFPDGIKNFPHGKLRPTKPVSGGSVPPPPPVKQKEPENLMDPLTERLRRRREAIMPDANDDDDD